MKGGSHGCIHEVVELRQSAARSPEAPEDGPLASAELTYRAPLRREPRPSSTLRFAERVRADGRADVVDIGHVVHEPHISRCGVGEKADSFTSFTPPRRPRRPHISRRSDRATPRRRVSKGSCEMWPLDTRDWVKHARAREYRRASAIAKEGVALESRAAAERRSSRPPPCRRMSVATIGRVEMATSSA